MAAPMPDLHGDRRCRLRRASSARSERDPNAQFISLEERDHYGALTTKEAFVLDAILRTLRGN